MIKREEWFATMPEVCAFVRGVELVNDSALTVDEVTEDPTGIGFIVILNDEDYSEDDEEGEDENL